MVRSRFAAVAFVLGILVHWTPSAHADVLNHYSFNGANGLSGNFTLDISAGLDSTGTDLFGTGYQLASPFSTLAGAYGPYTFGGNANLQIFDSIYDDGFCCADSWIVRAGHPTLSSLSGNTVNGRSVTGLNLFIGALFLPNVVSPVPPAAPDPHMPFAQYSYTISFSDGTFDQGSLGSLQFVSQEVVAEPATFTLLIIGSVGISLLAKTKRSSTKRSALVGNPLK